MSTKSRTVVHVGPPPAALTVANGQPSNDIPSDDDILGLKFCNGLAFVVFLGSGLWYVVVWGFVPPTWDNSAPLCLGIASFFGFMVSGGMLGEAEDRVAKAKAVVAQQAAAEAAARAAAARQIEQARIAAQADQQRLALLERQSREAAQARATDRRRRCEPHRQRVIEDLRWYESARRPRSVEELEALAQAQYEDLLEDADQITHDHYNAPFSNAQFRLDVAHYAFRAWRHDLPRQYRASQEIARILKEAHEFNLRLLDKAIEIKHGLQLGRHELDPARNSKINFVERQLHLRRNRELRIKEFEQRLRVEVLCDQADVEVEVQRYRASLEKIDRDWARSQGLA